MVSEPVFSFKKRIDSIQILRFILAFLVFLSHFESLTELHINFAAPVFLFYTISGFVAMLSTRNSGKVKGFLKRRFVRLLPLYWTLTLFTFAASKVYPSIISYSPSVVELIKSLFCIPFSRDSVMTGNTIMRPIVGPAHTLEVEIFFSVIFFICMKISHKNRGLITSIVCALLFIVGEVLSFFNIHTQFEFFEFYITHNKHAWLYFLLGIVLFKIFTAVETKSVHLSSLKKHSILSIILSAVLFVLITILHDKIESNIYYIIQAFAGFFLIGFLILLSQYDIKMPRFLVFCGNISFSFYLLHYYIVHMTEKLLHLESASWMCIPAIIIALTLSLLAAWVSYLLFEKKIPKLL